MHVGYLIMLHGHLNGQHRTVYASARHCYKIKTLIAVAQLPVHQETTYTVTGWRWRPSDHVQF
jgi:hypothetical protein